jgi:aminoglycoside 2''-phosphotransferase
MDAPERYLDLIRSRFPELASAPVEFNGEGLEHDVVIVDGRRVFRFPKHEWARANLQRETGILERVRRAVDLPVPHFFVAAPDFVAYDLIVGEPLFRDDWLRLDAAGQARIAAQLGTFLRQLHSLPAADIAPTDARRTRDQWLGLYADVERELFPLMLSPTRTWVKRHFAPLAADERWLDFSPAIIHADLAQYHILFDRQQAHLSGIIDFGTAGNGDPALDLGILINVYGETLLDAMQPSYPAATAMRDRARFYAGTFELQWVLGGIRSKDASWFTVHLDRARDVKPYGS